MNNRVSSDSDSKYRIPANDTTSPRNGKWGQTPSGDKHVTTGHITRACGPGQGRRTRQTPAIFLPRSCTALGKPFSSVCPGSTAVKGQAKLFPYFRKAEAALRYPGAGVSECVPSGEEGSRYCGGRAWHGP